MRIRRALAALLVAAAFPPAAAPAADTLRVVTHDGVVVVTDEKTGSKSYPAWGVFPSADVAVRNAVLRIRFACPDSVRCADWDYLDRVVIRRKGGAGSAPIDHEIGRMITPYGGAFGPDWTFEWTVDVTDFTLLLRDSVEIDYVHTGYEPSADRGWKITLSFDLVTGVPAARPLSIRRIYDGSHPYGDPDRPIAASLSPVSFTADTGVDFARLLIFQTGHGGDDSGCGEFCDRYRDIFFDGVRVDRRQIWKSCGENPLWPQAGTWIYDRANWCPGELVAPDTYDFPVKPGSEHTIDVEMEPYVLPGTQAVEAVCAYLIQYAPPAAEADAGVVDIVVPSRTDLHRRSNPACADPKVVVRNNGSAPLTSLYLRYGTIGFDDRSYRWEGNLAFGETAEIELPGEISARAAGNRYRAVILGPNGGEDAWPEDNELVVPFDPVPAHGPSMTLELRTNNEPSQTSWTLRRSDFTLVREAKPRLLPAATIRRDTFQLEPGCYELVIGDSAGDGLEFWYNAAGGRGYARLFDASGAMLRAFESDFGRSLRYNFRVTHDRRMLTAPAKDPAVGVFPTRTTGATTLEYFSNSAANVEVRFVTDPGGETAASHLYPSLRSGSFSYDLAGRGPARYYVRVFVDGALKFNRRIRVVEKLE